jgi:hypothetical protein
VTEPRSCALTGPILTAPSAPPAAFWNVAVTLAESACVE